MAGPVRHAATTNRRTLADSGERAQLSSRSAGSAHVRRVTRPRASDHAVTSDFRSQSCAQVARSQVAFHDCARMCQPALAKPGTGQCREGANPALASAGVKFPALASEKSSQLHCWPVQGKRRTRSFLLTQSGQCRARSVCNCSARGIASRGRLACALASCDARARAMWSARARCVGGDYGFTT